MEIASIILSTLALISTIPLWALFLAKNYFSSHVVQLVPAEAMGAGPSLAAKGRPMDEPFKEIGDPLSEEEEEWFKKQASQ